VAALALVLCLLAGSAMSAASADSLPGDRLYALKEAGRHIHLALSFDPGARQVLMNRLEARQREEVGRALVAGHRTAVEFHGVLEEIEPGRWTVGGLSVTLGPGAAVEGRPAIGTSVLVRGKLEGGLLLARELVVEGGEEAPPWPNATPNLSATPSPSTTAQASATPFPSASPSPSWAATAETTPAAPNRPTAETHRGYGPGPSPPNPTLETQGPVGTATPGKAPTAELTGQPHETPEPEETSRPSPTPEPEETPEAEETPEHDKNHEAGKTPGPDEAPEPGEDQEHSPGTDDSLPGAGGVRATHSQGGGP
jgi:hypothetical protein